MGSAALFFSTIPNRAILGDTNSDLVDTFLGVRDDPLGVHEKLMAIPIGKESYYRVRAMLPSNLTRTERAARFIFLNRFCYNGLYRTNAKGKFNVPYSATKTGRLPSRRTLVRASAVLRSATIYCSDFATTVREASKGDFVYFDPPYAVTGRRVFREYGPHAFDHSDLKRLIATMRELDSRGVDFVLSYTASGESVKMFADWPLISIETTRSISGAPKSRGRESEIIVSNIQLPLAPEKEDHPCH